MSGASAGLRPILVERANRRCSLCGYVRRMCHWTGLRLAGSIAAMGSEHMMGEGYRG